MNVCSYYNLLQFTTNEKQDRYNNIVNIHQWRERERNEKEQLYQIDGTTMANSNLKVLI